jgi:hypothetical protein
MRRVAIGRLGLSALVLLGAVGLATSALGGPGSSKGDSLTVRESRAGLVSKASTIHCSADSTSRTRCARVARLMRPGRTERCLQIWGGPDRTVITWANNREVITRANSCEIVRAKRVASLLD